MDSSDVIYSYVPLTHIPLPTNSTLQAALVAIDTALNTTSSAPNYSGYSLACVTQTDGTSHPTNTQNFAEGISKILCDFKTAYTTFTGTTYPAAISTLTTGITGLQTPGYTYAPFSITSADGINTVWSKTFTGLTGITSSISPASANWSSLGLSSQATIVAAFNAIIAKELTQDTTIAAKQALIGTFDNSTNCLSGTSTDTIATTVGLLTTKVCSLPVFNPSSITSTCVSAGTSLQQVVQNTINVVESLSTGSVRTAGTGIVFSGSGCGGKTASVDTTWNGLYKVMSNSSDTTPNYIGNKLTSVGGTVTIDLTTNPGNIDLAVTNPTLGKVKVNASDSTSDYIGNKIQGISNIDWGIGISLSPSSDNSKLNLNITVDPGTMAGAFMKAIAADPALMSQFCVLNTLCTSCNCTAVTGFTVAATS